MVRAFLESLWGNAIWIVNEKGNEIYESSRCSSKPDRSNAVDLGGCQCGKSRIWSYLGHQCVPHMAARICHSLRWLPAKRCTRPAAVAAAKNGASRTVKRRKAHT